MSHDQVQTIGDAYEVVSGAPISSKFHAVYIADLAFDMVEEIKLIGDPSSEESCSHLKIRLGEYKY